MDDSSGQTLAKSDPKLRHEFVGMMFAVTIAEVGLQAASLVKAGHWVHFLPAYSHLVMATVMIAASWVGWTLSPSPGARQDVSGVFQPEFLVLLVDVLLVICYFILVKAVDITGEQTIRLNASAAPEAHWVIVIFWLYFFWDILTKMVVYGKRPGWEWWWGFGIRIVVTIFCLVLAYCIQSHVANADPAHVLTADAALLSLVLLFRALKAVASAFWPTQPHASDAKAQRLKKLAIGWTVVCLLGCIVFVMWTTSWPMFDYIAVQIQTVPTENDGQTAVPIERDHPADSIRAVEPDKR